MATAATVTTSDVRPGDDVRVLEGPFAGQVGKYLRPKTTERRTTVHVVLLDAGGEEYIRRKEHMLRISRCRFCRSEVELSGFGMCAGCLNVLR